MRATQIDVGKILVRRTGHNSLRLAEIIESDRTWVNAAQP